MVFGRLFQCQPIRACSSTIFGTKKTLYFSFKGQLTHQVLVFQSTIINTTTNPGSRKQKAKQNVPITIIQKKRNKKTINKG